MNMLSFKNLNSGYAESNPQTASPIHQPLAQFCAKHAGRIKKRDSYEIARFQESEWKKTNTDCMHGVKTETPAQIETSRL